MALDQIWIANFSFLPFFDSPSPYQYIQPYNSQNTPIGDATVSLAPGGW